MTASALRTLSSSSSRSACYYFLHILLYPSSKSTAPARSFACLISSAPAPPRLQPWYPLYPGFPFSRSFHVSCVLQRPHADPRFSLPHLALEGERLGPHCH